MKKITPNIWFYFTITAAFFFICVIFFSACYFILEDTLLSWEVVLIKFIFFLFLTVGIYIFFIQRLYFCIKIHKYLKEYSYPEILELLKMQRKASENAETLHTSNDENNEDSNAEELQKQELIQENISYYAWLRNSNCQKALTAFVCAGLLLAFMIFVYISIPLILLAFALFIFGFISFFKGDLEVA